MEHLTDTTVDDLKQTLETVDEKVPALRLVAAIAYKNGVTQSELADWLDVERKTIYNWLTRMGREDLETAIVNEHRAGRPRKLSDDQLDTLKSALQHPPSEVGYGVPAWTTDIFQQFIEDRFEIDYSRPSCRRLMKEAGLRHKTASQVAADADPEIRDELSELGHIWVPG